MGKKILLEPVLTCEGAKFSIPDRNGVDGAMKDTDDLRDLLRLLCYNIPRVKLTIADSTNAADVIMAMADTVKNKSEVLELSEGLHGWLGKTVDAYAPAVFGVNAAMIRSAVDNFQRARQPGGKEK